MKLWLFLLIMIANTLAAGAETRPRQQVGSTLQNQPLIYEQAPCNAQYAVEFKDVDDVGRAYIDEELLFQSFWGRSGIHPGEIHGIGHKPGNSGGLVDITPYLHEGATHLKIELYNAPGCCSAALEVVVLRDDTVIFSKKLRMGDSSEGIKFSQEIVIDRQSCGAQREEKPKTAGGNS
jgi:hypothetical protein